MNIFTRIGIWWDNHRGARQIDLIGNQDTTRNLWARVDKLEQDAASGKELRAVKLELDKLKRFVGSPRDTAKAGDPRLA